VSKKICGYHGEGPGNKKEKEQMIPTTQETISFVCKRGLFEHSRAGSKRPVSGDRSPMTGSGKFPGMIANTKRSGWLSNWRRGCIKLWAKGRVKRARLSRKIRWDNLRLRSDGSPGAGILGHSERKSSLEPIVQTLRWEHLLRQKLKSER